MLCWHDKTYCSNDTCARYQTCKNSFYTAKQEQAKATTDPARKWPICFRKMECKEYMKK